MKKSITITLIIISFLTGIIITKLYLNKNNNEKTIAEKEKIEISRVIDQDSLKNDDDLILADGETIVELNNGSWYSYNDKNKLYMFQAAELGDWDKTVETKEQLQKLVNTYINIANENL